MAQAFLRIDLANQAKDFQNTVIEAGWPLIDKANANCQILRKWLGAAVAEPERQGDEVLFYLRNESGARIDQPDVLKITDKDLMGPLKAEFQGLIKTLQTAEPKNSAEKTLHAKALQELQALATEKRASDRRCCLFKYRDDKKKWHLVWAPGYRRRDEQPAKPIVCTNPDCSLLFLQRPDGTDKCPRCQKKPGPQRVAAGGVPRSRMPLILALLLLVAVLGGAGWWYMNRDTGEPEPAAEPVFAVSPESATITQDDQIEYKATFKDAEGNETDVTKMVSVRVWPQGAEGGNAGFAKAPVKYDMFHNKAEPKGVGTAVLEFFYLDSDNNKYTTKATLVVKPPSNPKVVTIVPNKLKLGIGTTAQLKLMGEYEDGHQGDLTDKADWNWEDPGQSGPVFAYKGAVQGMSQGRTKLKARYRATPDSEYVIAEADVEVADFEYKSLNLALASEKVTVGQDPGVTVEAVTADGEKMSVLGSALLKLEVEPQELADVQKQSPYLYPLKAGQGTLRATFRGLTKEIPLEVEGSDPSEVPGGGVYPQNLKLAVGEIADIDLPRGPSANTRLSSSDLNIVEVTPHNRLIGKSPGKATVTVGRGDQKGSINVEVAAVPFQGIDFDPSEVSVRVDDVVALRVVGRIDEDTQVELDPQLLEWVQFPTDDYLELNRDPLDVRGLQPTGNDHKTLVVRLNEHEATAKVRVIPAPLTLALEPAGPIELPQGQTKKLKVIATYGNGNREEIPADRVKWNADPLSGLTLREGLITAEEPNVGPMMVSVSFQGQKSNEVEIRTAASAPVRLALAANPATLAVGENGGLELTAQTPGGQDVSLDMTDVKFESGDESLVEVDPRTGGFRAKQLGTVTVTATHPASSQPVSAKIQVTAAPKPPSPIAPESVQLVTEQSQPIALPIGVGFTDFKVMANLNGESTDVTIAATLIVQGDPMSATVQVRDGKIYAIRAGEATVKAEFNGKTTENELRFNAIDEFKIDRIALTPSRVNLTTNESTRLVAEGFLGGRSVGIITDRSGIEWISADENIAAIQGPTVTALSPGTTQVTAKLDDVVSNPVEVAVTRSGIPGGILKVEPSIVTLQPNESVEVGRNVRVFRNDTDMSRQAAVSSANSDIVSYDEATGSLKAGSPGKTRVTFVVGNQTADLDVVVLSEPIQTAGGRLIIEPGSGILAVGERLPLRVTLITANGKRVPMTSSARFSSSNEEIVKIDGAGAVGVKPGVGVTVRATVPGIADPAEVFFAVANYDFTRLEISPWDQNLFVGQKQKFKIFAVGPAGRRELGTDPNLKVTLKHGDENDRIEPLDTVNAQGFRVIDAAYPTNGGRKTVTARWNDLETSASYHVTDNRYTGLLIRPQQASIEVGETLDYQVFARYTSRLAPLSNLDGVLLSVDDPAIASRTAGLRVKGESVGRTGIVAEYEGHRATAELIVRPPTHAPPPPRKPIGVRFLVNTSSMELKTPGDLVELVYTYPDGSTSEVNEQVELTANPEGVVEIEYRGNVPFIRPAKIGQTQLHARVGPLQTERPMLVEVVENLPGNPRLIVNPNPLILSPGETDTFRSVAFLGAGARNPVDVPYKVTATTNDVFEVEDGRVIRAKAPGTALATITVDDPENRYHGMSARAQVYVRGEDLQTQLRRSAELELRGPSRTTEGAEVEYQVRLVDGGNAVDVTNEATLVFAVGEDEFAAIQPGCRVIAKKPGTVHLSARYDGKISNTIPLTIHPLDQNFERLELVIRKDPIGVGETRQYQVWGHPDNGGPRQNLTRLITTDRQHPTRPHIRFNVLEPNASANVATHDAPNLIGRNPGKVALQAAIGDRLVSNREEVSVIGVIRSPTDLRVEPATITSRVGEMTPPLKVLVRTRGDRRYRELDPELASYLSLDQEILEPVADATGRFTAKRPGNTRIRVTYEGLTAGANVTVVANRFQQVELGTNPEFAEKTFTVPITVRTDLVAGPLEYRLYSPGVELPPEQGWKDTTAQGDQQFVKLTSPVFNLKENNLYRVVIEARDKRTKAIDRYPYAFRLVPKN